MMRTLDFYTDDKKRVRPITPRSGRMKGAIRSQRYVPSQTIQQRGDFVFEETNWTYPTGFATVTKQMRIEKEYPDGTMETWSIQLEKAPQNKTFYKGKYGNIESIDKVAERILPVPTFDQYYSIHQSFRNKHSKDMLGGYQSGETYEVGNPQKVQDWLKIKKERGYYQVPMRRKL